MISARRLGKYLWVEPFRPFLIRLHDGKTVAVLDPDAVMVGVSSIVVAEESEDEPDRPPRRREIPLAEIASVE